ncbi:hypothetical protein [Accumulibacter sp.]|uniref:hypothetical protein n=1 Tax=Accumulibacter sp. TaxID=2053492 RepID=UPI0025E5A107|nr:hypothetical protein [Accumulibacter sp.]
MTPGLSHPKQSRHTNSANARPGALPTLGLSIATREYARSSEAPVAERWFGDPIARTRAMQRADLQAFMAERIADEPADRVIHVIRAGVESATGLSGGSVMADPADEPIQEIAAKHRVAVSRDDPTLIRQTINTRLVQDSARAQQVMLDPYEVELEALALRWGNDAKAKAERILDVSLAASKEATAKLMQEGAKEAAASGG